MRAQFVLVTLVEGAEIYVNTAHIVSVTYAFDKSTKRQRSNAIIQLDHPAFDGSRGYSIEVDETPTEILDFIEEGCV